MHAPIYVTYLNGLDVAELKLTDEEILAAIESSPRRAGPRADGDRAAHAPDA
jgi:hypothetical protein